MKHHHFTQNQKQNPAAPSRVTAVADSKQNEINFIPSPDEVARRAYFSYVNQGSRSEHEVQHWLAAEAELILERDRSRVHGFHNRS